MIPVSAFPVPLQAAYYSKWRTDAGLASELLTAEKQPKNVIKKAFEEYSQAEREEIALWCKIVQDWQNTRARFKHKTEVVPLFVGKCRLENPDIDISVDILYRKYKAYCERGFDCTGGQARRVE